MLGIDHYKFIFNTVEFYTAFILMFSYKDEK